MGREVHTLGRKVQPIRERRLDIFAVGYYGMVRVRKLCDDGMEHCRWACSLLMSSLSQAVLRHVPYRLLTAA